MLLLKNKLAEGLAVTVAGGVKSRNSTQGSKQKSKDSNEQEEEKE